MRDFNRIADIYDHLTRFFFGKNIVKCQTNFIHLIPNGAHILILGGGTGWIIDEVKGRCPDCKIWYVDQSSRMISLARTTKNSSGVIFIEGSISDIPVGLNFDVVITNFFLDLFPEQKLLNLLSSIKVFLKVGGIWLVSDFVNERGWHTGYLFVMYCFFKLSTGIEAWKLPPWEELMGSIGLIEVKHRFFYGGFMKSMLYKRMTSF
ncbi:MAG TPA: methyltransferase domain-containing protein [Cyclobacteriaceae bacterium]|nr:methyltransferase domain-containing protein [Cyclobacteriaceae bacterium]